jgi:hypothetical protein
MEARLETEVWKLEVWKLKFSSSIAQRFASSKVGKGGRWEVGKLGRQPAGTIIFLLFQSYDCLFLAITDRLTGR